MAITDPLILFPEAVLVPVLELPDAVRARFTHEAEDWALTHPRLRSASRILDARAAELVSEFREPVTIVEAVIRFSRAKSTDPETTLEEAYPLLEQLVSNGFLVPASAVDGESHLPALYPGEEVAGGTVLECVQSLEDTEIYLVRLEDGGTAALKIERPSPTGRIGGVFQREAAILEHLEGDPTPRLLGVGEHGEHLGRRWLLMEWCAGIDVSHRAWELRAAGAEKAELLALCRAVAAAYARLHARGVVHADVHPRNVLVTAESSLEDQIRLVDFGLSRWDDAPAGFPSAWRGGVAFFYEPELAVALRNGGEMPPASPAGEQYAVAALLYQLCTGANIRDFSLEKDEMLRQLIEEPPLPFAERGVEPWPEMEAVLGRALSKAPEERFPSVADLEQALAGIVEAAGPSPMAEEKRRAGEAALGEVLSRVLARFVSSTGRDGALLAELPVPPRASVTYGAAGIAHALYRIALAREDASLLSLAELWGARADRAAGQEGAFVNPAIGMNDDEVGAASVYHRAAGIHCVRAQIYHVLGAPAARDEAVAAFVQAAREPCPESDLTLGRTGALLAAALLLDPLPPESRAPVTALGILGKDLLQGLWPELDALPPVEDGIAQRNLGIAHGWAGHLYATLRWCRSAREPLPPRLPERLAELAACARPSGRGMRWIWAPDRHGGTTMPGWCNGTAGMVFLWALAAEMLNEPAYRELAESAAWNAWEAGDRNGTLCCGTAGRAYALLHLWRKGAGPQWLDRARGLAVQAARWAAHATETPDSLYKGEVGVAVLAADLARPEAAALPFFEEEGW
jgi:serine/threonine-protein kinase